MRMIDRIKQAMRDTGVCDGMSDEDLDIAAMAGLEAMREPTKDIVESAADAMTYVQDMSFSFIALSLWKHMLTDVLEE